MPTKKDDEKKSVAKKTPAKKTTTKTTTAKKTPAKKTTTKTTTAKKTPAKKTPIKQDTENVTNVTEFIEGSNNNFYYVLALFIVTIFLAIFLVSQQNPKKMNGDDDVKIDNITNNNTTIDLDSNLETSTKTEVSTGDTVKVDYIGKLEDGTIFDSSIEEYAKQSPDYIENSGRDYAPLEFMVGAGQMIAGFDAGVVGMKLGEKKTITIEPKDAYGEAFIEEEVELKFLQDNFLTDIPKEFLKDYIERSFPINLVGDTKYNVGDEIEIQGIKGKVLAIDDENITLGEQNTGNPFFGKKLEVGLIGEANGAEIEIREINEDSVTVNVHNLNSPFYGKEIKVGTQGTLPDGQTVTISEINGDIAKIQVPNTHKLAGKTLIFEVEIKEIK